MPDVGVDAGARTAAEMPTHVHGRHADGVDVSMFGRRRTLTCRAGEWTTEIHTPFAPMPATWTLRLVADRGAVAGEFEETKSGGRGTSAAPGERCQAHQRRRRAAMSFWNYGLLWNPDTANRGDIGAGND